MLRSLKWRSRILDCQALQDVQEWLEEDENNVDNIVALKSVMNEVCRTSKRRRMVATSNNDGTDDCVDDEMCHTSMSNDLEIAGKDRIKKILDER